MQRLRSPNWALKQALRYELLGRIVEYQDLKKAILKTPFKATAAWLAIKEFALSYNSSDIILFRICIYTYMYICVHIHIIVIRTKFLNSNPAGCRDGDPLQRFGSTIIEA